MVLQTDDAALAHENAARRNCCFFGWVTGIFWLALVAMTWVVDPYHVWHETRWNRNRWSGTDLWLNLGQIEGILKKSDRYDTILLGNSHTQSFRGHDLTQAVHGKGTLKLVKFGSHVEYKGYLLKKAISTEEVKHVVIGVDTFSYIGADQYLNPSYLWWYDHPGWNMWNPVMIKTTFDRCVMRWRPVSFCSDLGTLYCWDDNPRSLFKDPSWLVDQRPKVFDFSHYTIEQRTKGFKELKTCLLDVMRDHPQVQFYAMIIPVYPMQYQYASKVGCDGFEYFHCAFSLWRYLVHRCASLSNVKVYGWHDMAWTTNASNYVESSHYYPHINRFMAYSIEHDLHRLTPENYDAYEQRCVNVLRAWKFPKSPQDLGPADTFESLVAAEEKAAVSKP